MHKAWGFFRSFLFFFNLLTFSFSNQSFAMTRIKTNALPGAPTDYDQYTPDRKPEDLLVSKITFVENDLPRIHYAKPSVPDPLDYCPMDDATTDLKTAVKNLIKEAVAAVKSIKDSTSDCNTLQNRISSMQSDVSTAITNQFVASAAISANATQNEINAATQKATAINQLFQATTDLFQNNCIQSMDKRIVIQKLLGQAITFGGLFAGGWTGIATAASGQLLGNLPIFRNYVDEADRILKDDEVKRNKIGFTCLYRQMAKTSCMLFTTSKHRFINGLDLDFTTGPAYTTKKTILEKGLSHPERENLADIQFLRKIQQTTEKLFPLITKEVAHDGSFEVFELIKPWCNELYSKDHQFMQLISPVGTHPIQIHKALNSLQISCEQFDKYDYPRETAEAYAPTIRKFKDDLTLLLDYYKNIRKNQATPLGELAKTWESNQYFDSLKKSLNEYQNVEKGNQARIDFLDLTNRLGNKLVKGSFDQVMKENYQFLTKSYVFSKRFGWREPIHLVEVKSNALISMLKACQTLDPSLACLYVDPPASNRLQKAWINHCVGPSSTLCKKTLSREESRKLLLNNPKFIAYFDSLCSRDQPIIE